MRSSSTNKSPKPGKGPGTHISTCRDMAAVKGWGRVVQNYDAKDNRRGASGSHSAGEYVRRLHLPEDNTITTRYVAN